MGYIWLKAAFILMCSTWLGLTCSEYVLSNVPDKWHARIYPLLLIIVLFIMLV